MFKGNTMKYRFLGLSISGALLCISCGGGSSSSSTNTPPPSTALANAEGQYRSNVGSGGGGYNYLYVLPDGSAYTGNTGTGYSGGRFLATRTSSSTAIPQTFNFTGTEFTAEGYVFTANNSRRADSSGTGILYPQSSGSVTGTISGTAASSTTNYTYSTNSIASVSLSSIASSQYSTVNGFSSSGLITSGSIGSSGSFSGSDSLGSFNGTLTQVRSNLNMFTFNATYSSSNSYYNATFSGVAVAYSNGIHVTGLSTSGSYARAFTAFFRKPGQDISDENSFYFDKQIQK